MRLEPMVEVFNLFNVTNVLGVSVKNYSGFTNALVRDSSDPSDPGYLRVVRLRPGGEHRRRRLRIGRPAGLPVRRPGDVLSADARCDGHAADRPMAAEAGHETGILPILHHGLLERAGAL